MVAFWILLVAIFVLGLWIVLGLVSYCLFRLYVDSLVQKLAVNMIAFPALFAIFLPVLRTESPIMIPIYFVVCAIFLGTTTILFHFIERMYGRA